MFVGELYPLLTTIAAKIWYIVLPRSQAAVVGQSFPKCGYWLQSQSFTANFMYFKNCNFYWHFILKQIMRGNYDFSSRNRKLYEDNLSGYNISNCQETIFDLHCTGRIKRSLRTLNRRSDEDIFFPELWHEKYFRKQMI